MRSCFRIESGSGFVEEKDRRPHGKGAGDTESLLLSAGKKGPSSVESFFNFFPQGRFSQRFLDDSVLFILGQPDSVSVVSCNHVVVDTHHGKWIRLLENHPDLPSNNDGFRSIYVLMIQKDFTGDPGIRN